jgi:hypothetical protein
MVCASVLQSNFLLPGPNPTISIYNAIVENFYNATGSLAHFEIKNILFYFENTQAY